MTAAICVPGPAPSSGGGELWSGLLLLRSLLLQGPVTGLGAAQAAGAALPAPGAVSWGDFLSGSDRERTPF